MTTTAATRIEGQLTLPWGEQYRFAFEPETETFDTSDKRFDFYWGRGSVERRNTTYELVDAENAGVLAAHKEFIVKELNAARNRSLRLRAAYGPQVQLHDAVSNVLVSFVPVTSAKSNVPAEELTPADMREAFERHIRQTCIPGPDLFYRDSTGAYWNALIREKWTVWVAACEYLTVQTNKDKLQASADGTVAVGYRLEWKAGDYVFETAERFAKTVCKEGARIHGLFLHKQPGCDQDIAVYLGTHWIQPKHLHGRNLDGFTPLYLGPLLHEPEL